MARLDNAITFGAGFNITSTSPIDSRMLVEYEDDLISSATWPTDKAPVYDGMTVTVKETGDIWVLLDRTKYTDKTTGEGWVKVGGDIDVDVTPQEVYDFLNENPNTILHLNNDTTVELIGTTITRDITSAYTSAITSAEIGWTVTSIGDNAFSGCTGLTSIEIPYGVTSIGNNVFRGCTSLTSIDIPDSVTSIGYQVCCDCTGLTSITVGNNNTHYDSRNNCNAIIETNSNTLIQGCSTTVIPNTVTSISNAAFGGHLSLTSITIDNNITSIGIAAFGNCGIRNIIIPDSISYINMNVFYNCISLSSVTIPNSVTNIGGSAFDGCSGLTSITYEGTKAQWGRISRNPLWHNGVPVTTVVQCSDNTASLDYVTPSS